MMLHSHRLRCCSCEAKPKVIPAKSLTKRFDFHQAEKMMGRVEVEKDVG